MMGKIMVTADDVTTAAKCTETMARIRQAKVRALEATQANPRDQYAAAEYQRLVTLEAEVHEKRTTLVREANLRKEKVALNILRRTHPELHDYVCQQADIEIALGHGCAARNTTRALPPIGSAAPLRSAR